MLCVSTDDTHTKTQGIASLPIIRIRRRKALRLYDHTQRKDAKFCVSTQYIINKIKNDPIPNIRTQ